MRHAHVLLSHSLAIFLGLSNAQAQEAATEIPTALQEYVAAKDDAFAWKIRGSDERDVIAVPPLDRDEREATQFVSRASLVRIVKPRVEEILELARDRLAASPFAAEPRARVVLTGGASQLTGLARLAAQILGRPVRIGRPIGVSGLQEEAKGPAFAVATGQGESAPRPVRGHLHDAKPPERQLGAPAIPQGHLTPAVASESQPPDPGGAPGTEGESGPPRGRNDESLSQG